MVVVVDFFLNTIDWGSTYSIVSEIITCRKVLHRKTVCVAVICHCCLGFYFVWCLACVLAFVLLID